MRHHKYTVSCLALAWMHFQTLLFHLLTVSLISHETVWHGRLYSDLVARPLQVVCADCKGAAATLAATRLP